MRIDPVPVTLRLRLMWTWECYSTDKFMYKLFPRMSSRCGLFETKWSRDYVEHGYMRTNI